MAKNRVKGITIQLGGDTTGLDKALKDTNKNISSTQSQLKDVERLLKLDPKNTELLAQKQKLLAEAAQESQEKFHILNEANKQLRDSVGTKVSSAQFDSLQREIVETRLDFQKLEKQSREVKKQIEDIDEQPIEDVADAADEAADAFDDASREASTFGDVLKAEAIVEGAKGIVEGLRDVVEETKEYRRIMGSLEVSSEAAGYTVEQTQEAYKKLYGVLADEQSAATTVANLQALGIPQEQLLGLIDDTIGAWAKYGDSIPIDGLAEAINETAKTGQVTGVLADVLNWGAETGNDFGLQLKDMTELELEYEALTADSADAQEQFIYTLKKKISTCKSITELIPLQQALDAAMAGSTDVTDEYIESLKKRIDEGNAWNESITEATSAEDLFGIALGQCSTEAERLDMIMQALSDQGLSDMAEKWKENNASMVEANETNADLQEQMAVLGEKIEPLATKLVDIAVKVLEWFNNLDSGTQDFIIGTVAIVAALGPVLVGISSVSKVIGFLTGTTLPGFSSIFSSVFSWIAANPIVLLLGAVALFGDQIQEILGVTDEFLQGLFVQDWTEVFGPVLGGILNGFFAQLKGIWDAVYQVFNGAIDFIRGVFTLDWERAWNGVKQIFAGIFDGLGTILKAPINSVLRLINKAIEGINWLIEGANKIPGVNIGTIGQIPLLANGGEVLRGSAIVGDDGPELLTVLGDRTVVQPLTTNNTYRSTALGGVNVNVYGAPGQDARELAEMVSEEIQRMVESEEAKL